MADVVEVVTESDRLSASHRARATLLRKVSASSDLSRTMRRAVRVLAEANIPSLVVGGYAVQENGYPRFTSDVGIIVPGCRCRAFATRYSRLP